MPIESAAAGPLVPLVVAVAYVSCPMEGRPNGRVDLCLTSDRTRSSDVDDVGGGGNRPE